MKMPIAYLDVAARYVELAPHTIFKTPTVADLGSPVGLYLEQPWVGLTFEEKQHALYLSDWKTTYMEAVIEYIEQRLKEKNT
jgi:hypothetical protein